MPATKGGGDVADKIEAQVREAILKMVSDIRSSIEDVREAVEQQLQAAMQSVQADANALSLRSQIQQVITEGGGASVAPTPAGPRGAELSSIKRSIRAVERGTTQIDILNSLLDQALSFGSRAALLILKGDSFAGWKGVGFGDDEAVKRFSAPASSVPELSRVLREDKVLSWNGANLASKLGAPAAKHAVLIPMVIKDKVSAVLYVDSNDPGKLNQSALELLVFTTGLLIDTLTIRKKIPSPTLSSEGEPARPSQTAPPAPQPAPAAPRPAAAPQRAAPKFEMESEPSRRADSYATTAIPSFTPSAPAPPPSRPAASTHGAAASGSGELIEKPSTQYIPPPGLKGGARTATPQPDDAKKHEEARRFARLLVSEIKLYNESKVDQGRKGRDIYERLKEDIDRSRQMYDERVAESVRKSSNYFYDELVRILADGDTDALGL